MSDDRISALPDATLCHILSFLSTREAVGTSLVSKRWKPLWLSVPTLDLDDQTYLHSHKPYSCFLKFVYAAISKTYPQRIKRFRLRCKASNTEPSQSDLNLWIFAVIQRGIEHLSIYLPFALNLPGCIFTCKTLVVLKLHNVILNAFSSVNFPSLKNLYLVHVKFPETRSLMHFLYGCPILQNLVVAGGDLTFGGYSTVTEAKSLSKLVTTDPSETLAYRIPVNILTCEIEFLRIAMFSAYVQGVPVFPNLTYVGIIVMRRMNWYLVFEMFKHCPKLQYLCLGKKPTFSQEGFTDQVLPYLHSVPECVSSTLKYCYLVNYEGLECELQFAKYIMQNSRGLMSMRIRSIDRDSQRNLEKLKELSLLTRTSATCVLSFETLNE
ncbi:hypothetical protein RJT34_15972 [Clitoria ternatea]|uniref:F-box domain-containing protein n=1 Tax=Clitoria ternatea TaxID=43366 RepID=A0AAN9J7L5_CLITE